jgi:hypothetical protein
MVRGERLDRRGDRVRGDADVDAPRGADAPTRQVPRAAANRIARGGPRRASTTGEGTDRRRRSSARAKRTRYGRARGARGRRRSWRRWARGYTAVGAGWDQATTRILPRGPTASQSPRTTRTTRSDGCASVTRWLPAPRAGTNRRNGWSTREAEDGKRPSTESSVKTLEGRSRLRFPATTP